MERIGGGVVTAGEVRDLLNTIVDPCSVAAGAPAGLGDMGLIRAVEVDDRTVSVRIGLTEPGCMMGASFVVRARELLAAQPGVEAVTVELEQDCDWSPALLDAEYARRLAVVRGRRRPPQASA
jgi:metal-sulfur cluster biosynthetic enzyme